MSTRRKRKLRRLALFCGIISAVYFLGFFAVHIFDIGEQLSEDWMNEDWHYIIACLAIICFLLYSSIVVRIYTKQSVPNPRLSGYVVGGIVLGVLFVLWSVALLMQAFNIG